MHCTVNMCREVYINTYQLIQRFTMMHIRMYMYAVGCGNLPRLSNSGVRISLVWTEDRSRRASSHEQLCKWKYTIHTSILHGVLCWFEKGVWTIIWVLCWWRVRKDRELCSSEAIRIWRKYSKETSLVVPHHLTDCDLTEKLLLDF